MTFSYKNAMIIAVNLILRSPCYDLSRLCRPCTRRSGSARAILRYGTPVSGQPELGTRGGQGRPRGNGARHRAGAALTGASPAEVIFTSGATEANNLAIKGIAQASRHIGKHIISTPLEHSSVSGSLTALQERGWEIDPLSIGRDGTVDPEEVRELLRPDTVLVAICAVDSELGTIQPIPEIAALLADHPNCRLHVDATQAIGRIPVDFSGIDTLSFAPHKFGGICGSGVLLKRSRMPLEPR
ncbi:MAG: cysteine desulfurase family protein [Butyricicoccus sp.]